MINLDELEAKARAATQGNWHLNKELSRPATKLIYDASGYLIANVGGYKFDDTENDKNAEFIATANPDTVLKLIAAMRVYRGALEYTAESPRYEDRESALKRQIADMQNFASEAIVRGDEILRGGV